MTTEEAIGILAHYDDYVWQRDNNITQGMRTDAFQMACDALEESITKERACDLAYDYGYEDAIGKMTMWLKNNGYENTNGWYTLKGTIGDFLKAAKEE